MVLLESRYGHVNDLDVMKKEDQFSLHICTDKKAVNQGLCQIKKNDNLYYMKARSNPSRILGDNISSLDAIPKELIIMEIEKPELDTGYKYADFYVTGIFL